MVLLHTLHFQSKRVAHAIGALSAASVVCLTRSGWGSAIHHDCSVYLSLCMKSVFVQEVHVHRNLNQYAKSGDLVVSKLLL